MLKASQSVLIIVVVVVVSISLLLILNRLWQPEKRRVHNDLIAWQLAILGTLYAVVVGFMLYAVWSKYDSAEINADSEATALIQLARTSRGLPTEEGTEIRSLANQYVDVMLNSEWPAMQDGHFSEQSNSIMSQLNDSLVFPVPLSTEQTIVLDHAMTEFSTMVECRRIRQVECISELPQVLWTVLISGAFITIISSCLLGSEHTALHVVLVLGLSFLISLCLVAIADINRPFQGATRIQPSGFERAQQIIIETDVGLERNPK